MPNTKIAWQRGDVSVIEQLCAEVNSTGNGSPAALNQLRLADGQVPGLPRIRQGLWVSLTFSLFTIACASDTAAHRSTRRSITCNPSTHLERFRSRPLPPPTPVLVSPLLLCSIRLRRSVLR